MDTIEEMIVSGELAAGNRINESTLAEQLGISRGPIREACRSLEQAGLLTMQANRGMSVRELSIDEAHQLYELRGAIAGLVGELLVKRAKDAEIADLVNLVTAMQRAADAANADDYYKLNLQFHETMVSATQNKALRDTYEKIVNQLHLLRRRGLVHEDNLQVSNQEHRDIVDAVQKRDATAASHATRRHVSNGLARLITSL